MRTKNSDKMSEIIKELQEQITNIDKEVKRLCEDKSLYQTIIQEINNNESYEYDSSQSSSDVSIEIIQDHKENTSHNIGQRTKVKEERQLAFEKARAWALDRKRNKKTK